MGLIWSSSSSGSSSGPAAVPETVFNRFFYERESAESGTEVVVAARLRAHARDEELPAPVSGPAWTAPGAGPRAPDLEWVQTDSARGVFPELRIAVPKPPLSAASSGTTFREVFVELLGFEWFNDFARGGWGRRPEDLIVVLNSESAAARRLVEQGWKSPWLKPGADPADAYRSTRGAAVAGAYIAPAGAETSSVFFLLCGRTLVVVREDPDTGELIFRQAV